MLDSWEMLDFALLRDKVTLSNISISILTILLVQAASQVIYYRLFSPIKQFPGPFWGSVTRLWVGWHCWRSTELITYQKLHRRYDPVIRITPTMLLVSDATKIPLIYHRRADKTKFYTAFSASFGKAEGVQHKKLHREHAGLRKIVAGPYSFSNIRKTEPLLDIRVDHWIKTLQQRFADTGEPFDFSPWAVYMAYDIISEMAFGAPLGFVKNGADINGLIQGFHDGLVTFGLLCRLHTFTEWFQDTWIGEKFLVSSPEDKSGVGVLMNFRDELLEGRIKEIELGNQIERVDLLQRFLDTRTPDGKPLEKEHIKAELLNILLAGADTTGTAFQGTLYYVTSNPEVYSRLMQELDIAEQRGVLSPSPSYDEVLAHCPYYTACVREAMRLCPSAPTFFPRLVPKGGLEFNGKLAPEGTEVTCNPWLTHRDKSVYGPDAEQYKPERWLDEKAAKEYTRLNLVFGYGSRICLGKDLAMMELYKAPLQFFRTFKVETLEALKPPKFNQLGGVGFWSDIWVRISNRKDC